MSGTLLLALLSALATTAYLGIFVALHVLPTGYNPIRHAVSDYAVGKYGYLFRIGLWASSLGVLALAFALIHGVGSPPLAHHELVYLFLIPIARIGMTRFPTDLEGRRRSRTGVLHYVFAIAAFTFTYLAISDTTPVLRHLSGTVILGSPLHWVAWLVAPELALVVITMFRPLRKVFGLFERLFLLTTNVWFIMVALLLIDRAK